MNASIEGRPDSSAFCRAEPPSVEFELVSVVEPDLRMALPGADISFGTA